MGAKWLEGDNPLAGGPINGPSDEKSEDRNDTPAVVTRRDGEKMSSSAEGKQTTTSWPLRPRHNNGVLFTCSQMIQTCYFFTFLSKRSVWKRLKNNCMKGLWCHRQIGSGHNTIYCDVNCWPSCFFIFLCSEVEMSWMPCPSFSVHYSFFFNHFILLIRYVTGL